MLLVLNTITLVCHSSLNWLFMSISTVIANTDRQEIDLFKEEAMPLVSWRNKGCFLPLINLICVNDKIEFNFKEVNEDGFN